MNALYEVWCDMVKKAKAEHGFYVSHGLRHPVRIAKEFKEFSTFTLWAVKERGYQPGIDSGKELIRIDRSKPYGPDNCRFVTRAEAVKLDDSLEYEISPGASSVIYKDDSPFKRKWQGLSKTRLYNIWKTTCRACNDPGQKDYERLGGKGIRVQEEWRKDFLVFEDWAWEHGYTDELSLVRINNDKDFTPNNCRWETKVEQRCSNSRGFEKVRLSVKRMREYLEKIDETAICTLIIAPHYAVPVDGEQDDLPSTPVEERIDAVRS